MSVLVVHTASPTRGPHLARARDYLSGLGERLILLMNEPSWEKAYVDVAVAVDTSDIRATVAAARDVAAREDEPIRGVITFVEHSVSAAAAVATALGVASVGESSARLARDKYAMRQAFARAGLPQPQFVLARTIDEALVAADRLGFPLVIKPVLGGGSKYVLRMNDRAALSAQFADLRARAWDTFGYDPLRDEAQAEYEGGVLLEQYVPGGEMSVESIVHLDRTHVVAMHDKPLPMTGPSFEELYLATPTALSAPDQAQVVDLTAAAHRALGITDCVTHTEFRLPSNGDPSILEVGARLGGGAIYESVRLSRGIDMVEAVVDLGLGRPVAPVLRSDPLPVGYLHIFAPRAGRVVGYRGVTQTRAHPMVRDVVIYKKVDDLVDVPPHVGQSAGHVLFTASTREHLDEVCTELSSVIAVDVR